MSWLLCKDITLEIWCFFNVLRGSYQIASLLTGWQPWQWVWHAISIPKRGEWERESFGCENAYITYTLQEGVLQAEMKRNRNRNQVNASLSVTLTVLGGSFLAASPHSRILSFWKTELTSSFTEQVASQARRTRRPPLCWPCPTCQPPQMLWSQVGSWSIPSTYS